LTESETRSKMILDNVCDVILGFMCRTYPNFDQDLKWVVFPITNFLCGLAPTPHQVGEHTPEVASPHVERGPTPPLLCATAVGKNDYLQVVPEFMR
jgi:hypothetical protein